MTTATTNFAPSRIAAPAMPSFTLFSVVEILMGVNLREKLNTKMTTDQSDAAYVWGL